MAEQKILYDLLDSESDHREIGSSGHRKPLYHHGDTEARRRQIAKIAGIAKKSKIEALDGRVNGRAGRDAAILKLPDFQITQLPIPQVIGLAAQKIAA